MSLAHQIQPKETCMPAVAKQNARSRKEWAEIINDDWRKAIGGIIQVGRDLIAAREELGKTAFAAMARSDDLPFSPQTAQRLMTIARDPKITNLPPSTRLPPSWRILSRLSDLSEEDFQSGVEAGVISEHTSLRSADAFSGVSKIPEGATWGADRKPSTLPSPSEARDIARETNRFVAASDGNVYSGATEEEGEDHVRRRQQTYGVIDAVDTLSDCDIDAFAWIEQAEDHWLHQFRIGSIDEAIKWLTTLRVALKEARGVVDAE